MNPLTTILALGMLLAMSCGKSHSRDVEQRDGAAASSQGEAARPASLGRDGGRLSQAGRPGSEVTEPATGSPGDAGADAGRCPGDGPPSGLSVSDGGQVQIPDAYVTGCEEDDDCVLVETLCDDCCGPGSILRAFLECFNGGKAEACAGTLDTCDCDGPNVVAICDSGRCGVRDLGTGAEAVPGWTSPCHELDRLGCEARGACGWATGAIIDGPFPPGCYERCPVATGQCGPGASCEVVLADSHSCGDFVCLPREALPTLCGSTIACSGEPATLCWLQHPDRCGPCDNCIDEYEPINCLVSPDAVRHWFGPPPFGEFTLPAGWTTCSGHPEALDCG